MGPDPQYRWIINQPINYLNYTNPKPLPRIIVMILLLRKDPMSYNLGISDSSVSFPG